MRSTLRLAAAGLALATFLPACSSNGPMTDAAGATRFDFESGALGSVPAGFHEEVGRWRLVATDQGSHALAQQAANDDETFNVALADEPRPKDLALRVRLRAVDGEIDQGGGPVWRARDKDNYYVCRYNPLEANFRVYKVIDGARKQLGSARVDAGEGWHEIGVRCVGAEIRCTLDGSELLNVRDASLPEAGRVGLWTKADAVTWFDDLVVEPR